MNANCVLNVRMRLLVLICVALSLTPVFASERQIYADGGMGGGVTSNSFGDPITSIDIFPSSWQNLKPILSQDDDSASLLADDAYTEQRNRLIDHFVEQENLRLGRIAAYDSCVLAVRMAEGEFREFALGRSRNAITERQRWIKNANLAGVVIFIVVHVLTLFAIYVAGVEFRRASSLRRGPSTTEFEVSVEGIAVRTTLHGIMLLVIAFAFYFLFLKFVYPISVITA